MAPLPDINERLVRQLSWWNALDHGADSFDPVALLDYVDVESWDAYDNGIEGSLRRHEALRFRAKADGHIITYFDESYGDVNPEDLLTSFTAGDLPDLTQTVLSEEINALRKQAPNSGQMTFNHADVGLYNFEYPDMDHYRVFARDRGGYGGATHAEYAVNPDEDLPEHYIVDSYVSAGASVSFDGSTLAASQSDTSSSSRDRLAESGRISEKGRYYETRSWKPIAGDASTATFVVE